MDSTSWRHDDRCGPEDASLSTMVKPGDHTDTCHGASMIHRGSLRTHITQLHSRLETPRPLETSTKEDFVAESRCG